MARHAFYTNKESNPLVTICAIMLFHYWDMTAMNTVNNTDTGWWWLGNAIRLAQEEGLHREGKSSDLSRPLQSLRKRIWWTLFYVELCDILGDISKLLAQGAAYFPATLQARKRLVDWIRKVPSDLQLSSPGNERKEFNRDVALLHIPYLGAIVMVYLSFSSDAPPKACVPGIVAASILARICEEFLARGFIRFVPEELGWFVSFSVLTLAHARRVDCLAPYSDADVWILLETLRQMGGMWSSAKSFTNVYEKLGRDLDLVDQRPVPLAAPIQHQCNFAPDDISQGHRQCTLPHCLEELAALDGVNWMDYFPYENCNTSPMMAAILAAENHTLSPSVLDGPFVLSQNMQEIFANIDEFGNFFSAE
ncbi:hypothetical protein LTR84_010576 [Exophiala bonariae]|uniref:Xylanolytic transcriptional activator regulatory domain-containing protein n=1 Tax=Exophiala bonariae TaxID=1690606 RepID=A0AAV9MTG0_9EURO|nr:hypothetical protein LTR84_010576 [Exophiala bonariae]